MYSKPTGTTATRRPITATEKEWGSGAVTGTGTHRENSRGGKDNHIDRNLLDDGSPDKERDEDTYSLYGERELQTRTRSTRNEGDKYNDGKWDIKLRTTVTWRTLTATMTEKKLGTEVPGDIQYSLGHKSLEEERRRRERGERGVVTRVYPGLEGNGLPHKISVFGYIKPCKMIRSCLCGIGPGGCVLLRSVVPNYTVFVVLINRSDGELMYEMTAYYWLRHCWGRHPKRLLHLLGVTHIQTSPTDITHMLMMPNYARHMKDTTTYLSAICLRYMSVLVGGDCGTVVIGSQPRGDNWWPLYRGLDTGVYIGTDRLGRVGPWNSIYGVVDCKGNRIYGSDGYGNGGSRHRMECSMLGSKDFMTRHGVYRARNRETHKNYGSYCKWRNEFMLNLDNRPPGRWGLSNTHCTARNTLDKLRLATAGQGEQGGPFTIFVSTLTGRTVTIEILPSSPIMDIKHKLREKLGIPVEYQRLVHGGKGLLDHRAIQEYNIGSLATLHLTIRLCGGSGGGNKFQPTNVAKAREGFQNFWTTLARRHERQHEGEERRDKKLGLAPNCGSRGQPIRQRRKDLPPLWARWIRGRLLRYVTS